MLILQLDQGSYRPSVWRVSFRLSAELTIAAMPTMDAGHIDYPASSTLTGDDFANLSNVGRITIGSDNEELLRRLEISWLERRTMSRPSVKAVTSILSTLLSLARQDRIEQFLNYMARLSVADAEDKPAEAHAYFTIAYDLGIVDYHPWRNLVENGAVPIGHVRDRIKLLNGHHLEAHRGRRGGQREHDLGFIIDALADIYRRCGGTPTAASLVASKGDDLGRWVVSSHFVRFCCTFIGHLRRDASLPTIKIGPLAKRVLAARRKLPIN